MQSRSDLVRMLIFHFSLGRLQGALDQLRQGLSVLKVLDYIQRYPDAMKEFFIWREISLTAGKFANMYFCDFEY